MLTINGLVGIMAQPHQLAAVGTGKRRADLPRGMLYGNMVKRVCTVGWALVGLIVAAMVAQGHGDAAALGDPENAFGFACRRAALSWRARPDDCLDPRGEHVDVLGVSRRQRRALHRRALSSAARARTGPISHYLWVGRVSGFVITMAGVLYAMYLIESVLYTFLLTETLATFVGISVLGGILWPRANRWGALASLLIALATNFLLYYVDRPAPRSLGRERVPRGAHRRHRWRSSSSAC